MENLLATIVRASNVHGTKSGIEPGKPASERYSSIDRSTFALDVDKLLGVLQRKSNRMSVRSYPGPRWVERTLSLLNNTPRLSKDYEKLFAEAIVNISNLHRMFERL